ncbi:chemotaxis protein MotA [Rhodovulum bhavnagarense]|uniref:Chemotaxis protein MotA n=1 Tax=Rhodovulum bhavnagarense TaxID=992286 RepID=A0A4R2RFV3_9RHOB|nr:MotA/TolQ/ExbB proton channel family protein [Rhodovulum bhavnagarense]TCP61398.1 chemotaxis protein MotA [Rhodovulum bhavnagarense]
MDIASIIGMLGAVGMVVGGMAMAGGIGPYIDPPSILIVFGGTFFAVMYKVPMANFLGSFKAMAKAFSPKPPSHESLIETMVEMSDRARKEGIMALDGADGPDPFFKKGLQMLVDGADETKLVKQMKDEIRAMKRRHGEYQAVLKGWIDIAPAMGMIGTLIGLVQMLGNMEDPKAIGPAMAVALLTTLYGAFIANIVFLPLLSKLEHYSAQESVYRDLVVEGLRHIARGGSGRHVQEQMVASLPPKLQTKLMAA